MLRSIWRSSIDRFSLQYFKYLINELQQIKVVDEFNREVVLDILQSIVETVTYGDKHDASIFECFMEHQVLAEFVRMVKMGGNSKIEASVLQYLSIMIQNLQNKHAIYYCFSNGYINNIITHEYEFNVGDLALYYVSFLRTVSAKLNADTLCLLVKVQEGAVTAFPLYTEAVRFAHHGEKMIQTAIRSLTLSIYNVCDDLVYKFLMTHPVSEYFKDLVLKLREECVHLDATFCTMGDNFTSDKRKELRSGIDKLLDDLYYIKDLLSVGKSRLNVVITQKLIGLLLVPIVIPLMQLGKDTGVNISAVTSLYILSCLLQVIDDKKILDSVAALLLYPHVASSAVLTAKEDAIYNSIIKPSSEHVNNIEHVLHSSIKSEEIVKEKLLGHTSEYKLSVPHLSSWQWDTVQERKGIFSYIFSDNQALLLGSIMILLVLAENADLENLLASLFGFPQTVSKSNEVVSTLVDGSLLLKCMPQILNALFKLFGSASKSPVLTQCHAGWSILKLISIQKGTPNDPELHLSSVSVWLNDSFHQASASLLNELNGCWFDYIPDTFKKEWTSCKAALQESARNKDPFFILEVAVHNEPLDGTVHDMWQRMVDAVKIFVLHLHLKTFILKGCLPNDYPLKNLGSNSLASPRSIHVSDASSAKFGSVVPLGSGIPCQIAFSKAGVRDIFMIPVAKGIAGKLLLVEKHPFQSRNGIVLAIAPLAGLTPKIDEKHATWLHLCIRDFNPEQLGRLKKSRPSNHEMSARWTLGFSDAEACEAAYLLIAKETSKQRSFVESILAPFLDDNYLGGEADSQVKGET